MQKLLLFLTLIHLALPSHAVEVSRSKLDHPALGTSGGSALHALIEAIYVKLGDQANSRYEEYTAVADSTTVELDHNFGVNETELKVLIYTGSGASLTRVSDPENQAPPWTIQEKTGSEKTVLEIITPSAGGPHTFAVIANHGKGVETLDELDDVDLTTPPEDGQALVYNSGAGTWSGGASGDASFKLQGVTDPNATIKGGGYNVIDGKQIASYDGVGSSAADFRTDLTCDLDAILGSSPADNTTYVLYIDLDSVGPTPTTTTDTAEELFPVECGDLVLLTTFPDVAIKQRYVHVGWIHSADSGTVWSGTGASFNTFFTRSHGLPVVNTSPVVYSLAEQTIGSVGSSNQIAAGHVLADGSFPSFTTEISYYNLGDINDDSSNARDLSNVSSLVFTGPDIFSNATTAAPDGGLSSYLQTSDAHFDPGDADFSTGLWVKADDWTPGTNESPISNWTSGTDKSWAILIDSGGTISIKLSPDGTAVETTSFAHAFVDGTYHHLAIRYVASTNTGYLYFDGINVASLALSGNLFNRVSPDLQVGGNGSGDFNHFDGDLDEMFFSLLSHTDGEIRKLASSRIDHNQNIALADQNWVANFNGDLANQLENGWMIDKSTNSIWFDFFDLASTDNVGLKLKNENASSHIIPLNTFDTGFLSAAPSFPLSHGLGSVPVQVAAIHEGQTTAGDYDDVLDKCSWDSAQVTCAGLNTVDGTHRLRIVLSTSTVAVAVAEATAVDSGIVTTQAQGFGGDKTFNDNVTIDGGADGITPKVKTSGDVSAGWRLESGTAGTGNIYFGDANDQAQGRIAYLHSDDSLNFYTSSAGGNGVIRQTIESDGDVVFTGSADRSLTITSTGNRAQSFFNGVQTGSDGEFAEFGFSNNGDSVAGIQALRDGADDAGSLSFLTQPTGGGVTERVLIESDGDVVISEKLGVGAGTTPLDIIHLKAAVPCMLFHDTDSTTDRRVVSIGCGGEEFKITGRNDTNTGDSTGVGTFFKTDLSTGASEIEVRTDGVCGTDVADGNVCSASGTVTCTVGTGTSTCFNSTTTPYRASRNGNQVTLSLPTAPVNVDGTPTSAVFTIQGVPFRTNNFSAGDVSGLCTRHESNDHVHVLLDTGTDDLQVTLREGTTGAGLNTGNMNMTCIIFYTAD